MISKESVSNNTVPSISLSLVQNVVQKAIDNNQLVGAAVIVAQHGKVIHREALGLSDRERSISMTMDTVFRLASVSKVIVSTTALVLVAQNKLNLDEFIHHQLPFFQPKLENGKFVPITLRQLLSHTAGLNYRFLEPDSSGTYSQAGVSDGMDSSDISLDENIRRIATVPLLYEPGKGWGYSLATDVLGALIEKVYGKPLDQAVRELVTDRLKMNNTCFVVPDNQHVATAYVSDSPEPHILLEEEVVSPFEGCVGISFSPRRIFNSQAFFSGGAGMAGTVEDFFSLLEALRQEDSLFLPTELIAEMTKDQTSGYELPNAPGFGFGLGFSVLRNAQQALSPESEGTWRWGGAYGHSWFVDKKHNLSVIAFTNTLYEGMSGKFVTDLRDAVYKAIGVVE
ncbi:serine hydrolase domain-containing protein [Acinetobacter calcoaceticus]|uniref:serine hydrolase domain-containing protein n=1 Tax=Acinetobacter calcoaceticus TaxID=471 RepID=UPI0005DAFBF0|nr:serine hydrolase domain-containing protein [Acinetobacter calcoaceticus]KJH63958.1 beta-lactamase [Acinetobacter calcoaceticus]